MIIRKIVQILKAPHSAYSSTCYKNKDSSSGYYSKIETYLSFNIKKIENLKDTLRLLGDEILNYLKKEEYPDNIYIEYIVNIFSKIQENILLILSNIKNRNLSSKSNMDMFFEEINYMTLKITDKKPFLKSKKILSDQLEKLSEALSFHASLSGANFINNIQNGVPSEEQGKERQQRKRLKERFQTRIQEQLYNQENQLEKCIEKMENLKILNHTLSEAQNELAQRQNTFETQQEQYEQKITDQQKKYDEKMITQAEIYLQMMQAQEEKYKEMLKIQQISYLQILCLQEEKIKNLENKIKNLESHIHSKNRIMEID